ncbi:MAG: hypothetical protein M3Y87_07860 [Myxococcota bacterium]|nr:hypothetical protein [Myxococcota bacterium]
MTRSAWLMTVLATAIVGVGCGPDAPADPCPVGMICPDGGPPTDAQTPEVDAQMRDADIPPMGCGIPGRLGGICRRDACLDGECIQEILPMGSPLTGRAFGWVQAQADDNADPSSWTEIVPADPALDVPVAFASGSLCTEQCNTTVSPDMTTGEDMCGSCAKCSGQLGQDSLGLPVFIFFAEAERQFAGDTGLCRAHCDFAAETNGGCPDGYSCDGFTNLCLEGCRSDTQCNASLVVTEGGSYGTWVNPLNGETCNTTTDRCDWTGPATAQVGTACERQAECATDVGFCLRGGTCAETQCNNPAFDPSSSMGICDDGRGVCLGVGGNMGALCIEGCNTAEECNPGNACVPLGMTIGTFSGYCFGLCDTVDSGAATGMADQLFGCRADEQCDMAEPDADDMDPDGTCRPSCDPLAVPSTCETDEICEAVTGATYGFCRPQGNPCFDSTGCSAGQICDNVVGAPQFGTCVDPCVLAATDCTAPATICVDATGPMDLQGLCVQSCTSPTTCGEGRVCRIPAGMTEGYCVEMP